MVCQSYSKFTFHLSNSQWLIVAGKIIGGTRKHRKSPVLPVVGTLGTIIFVAAGHGAEIAGESLSRGSTGHSALRSKFYLQQLNDPEKQLETVNRRNSLSLTPSFPVLQLTWPTNSRRSRHGKPHLSSQSVSLNGAVRLCGYAILLSSGTAGSSCPTRYRFSSLHNKTIIYGHHSSFVHVLPVFHISSFFCSIIHHQLRFPH